MQRLSRMDARLVDMLAHGILPVLVFDGCLFTAKAATDLERLHARLLVDECAGDKVNASPTCQPVWWVP